MVLKSKFFGFSLLSLFLLTNKAFAMMAAYAPPVEYMPPDPYEIHIPEPDYDPDLDEEPDEIDHSICHLDEKTRVVVSRVFLGGAAATAAASASRLGKLCIHEVMRLSHHEPALPSYVLHEMGDPEDVARIPRETTKLFTIVLDLDETLISGRGFGRIRVRAFARSLLRYLTSLGVEVIVWTAGDRRHAVNSIYALGRGERGAGFVIDHLIYKSSAWLVDGATYQKDLCLLDRSNVFLVDNTERIVNGCQGFAALVENFEGDYDADLYDFMKLLHLITQFVSEGGCRPAGRTGAISEVGLPVNFLKCFFDTGPLEPTDYSFRIVRPESLCPAAEAILAAGPGAGGGITTP